MTFRTINQSFVKRLQTTFGTTQFSTSQAESIYHEHHWVSYHNYPREVAKATRFDEWGRMSARNSLCAGVQHKYLGLTRVKRGVYQFV